MAKPCVESSKSSGRPRFPGARDAHHEDPARRNQGKHQLGNFGWWRNSSGGCRVKLASPRRIVPQCLQIGVDHPRPVRGP